MIRSCKISTDKHVTSPSAIAELLVNLEGSIHISGMAEARAVKFCTEMGYIKSYKSYQKNEKSPPKRGVVMVT